MNVINYKYCENVLLVSFLYEIMADNTWLEMLIIIGINL